MILRSLPVNVALELAFTVIFCRLANPLASGLAVSARIVTVAGPSGNLGKFIKNVNDAFGL
jgi:hypothetical protein